MPTNNVFSPKQQRSQDTQRKLLVALHTCLQHKFFEHITIKELAELAGVSVGTFYRRFKDKESLLPLLYQDFGNDLAQWVNTLEQQKFVSLYQALEQISLEMYQFAITRKSVFRTLHLNSRLHSELLTTDKTVDRNVIYQKLADVLLIFADEMTVDNKEKSAQLVIFTIINTMLEKILYPGLTPAIACDMEAKELATELPKMMTPYLTT
jgi:AcrR family transcriptional regulator